MIYIVRSNFTDCKLNIFDYLARKYSDFILHRIIIKFSLLYKNSMFIIIKDLKNGLTRLAVKESILRGNSYALGRCIFWKINIKIPHKYEWK